MEAKDYLKQRRGELIASGLSKKEADEILLKALSKWKQEGGEK